MARAAIYRIAQTFGERPAEIYDLTKVKCTPVELQEILARSRCHLTGACGNGVTTHPETFNCFAVHTSPTCQKVGTIKGPAFWTVCREVEFRYSKGEREVRKMVSIRYRERFDTISKILLPSTNHVVSDIGLNESAIPK
jgi:hypothetical protein